MLTFHSSLTNTAVPVALDARVLPTEINWIDAVSPSEPERAFLERVLGTRIPTFADLSEIESTSRIYSNGGYLFLSMPAIFRGDENVPITTPLGFVLSKSLLISLRFEPLKSFENLQAHITRKDAEGSGGAHAFVAILEVIIDHVADLLEHIGTDLDCISQDIFGFSSGPESPARRKNGKDLREVLRRIGRIGNLTSKLSEMLLGVGRIIPFVVSNPSIELSSDEKSRLNNLGRDIASLNEYETRLTDKTQFLLDATLGLTNVDQNDIFRILTVVSVVGIPPTFIASMYGMNFKNIPEYDWAFGYQYGLALIFISTLLPLLWFKRKGWW
ncbi:magnesium transporter CorA family protein [Beijerinckia indica]|uniref:Magnesium transport protein CorA n=1 Tax=Beijerinckia indica subsp. indica (strain ATCC 9039 / DSM 1715 / NCIMB 8712) TaxID=395963 RepID=B2IEP0_BEII9|nr:magnesium transporter CorA family protein [Beijerinckia indica]ACB96980.1 Mg2 transporter protein CorA family protein [Beijerinckia indica subsp. indica ATCC 9039]